MEKQLAPTGNRTATKAIGATTLIKLDEMTEPARVVQGSLFWGKATDKRDAKNRTTTQRTRPRQNNGLPRTIETGGKWISALC